MSTSTARKPMKPGGASSRSGSGRPATDISRGTSNPRSSEAGVFNAKEASEFLASRLNAAQEASRKWAELSDEERGDNPAPVFVYQGETRAWGGTRPFNPIKDDFLQLVEMAIDSFKQNNSDSGISQE